MNHTKSTVLLLIIIISAISVIYDPFRITAAQTVCNMESVDPSTNIILVILVHGYKEGSEIWSLWEEKLSSENIPYCNVTFVNSDDKCGTAKDHAQEIGQIIKEVKEDRGVDQVNIVAHSKGGLDAKLYLSNTNNQDVKNLIMIGTPNGGGPLADNVVDLYPWLKYSPPNSNYCTPALFDLETTSDLVGVEQNPSTTYYTIFGDWEPSLDCRNLGFEHTGFEYLNNSGDLPNDGIVPAWSSEELDRHINLGKTNHCHTDLLNIDEYNMSRSVLAIR